MKYIYYIILIISIFSISIGYELFSDHSSKEDAVIIINDRVINVDEFKNLYSLRPSHLKEKSDFVDSLITKELLIQEAQKMGINKEESFRISIQNFYEQSLTKILMDRQFSSLKIEVNDKDVDWYVEMLSKKLYLTSFEFDDENEAKKGEYTGGERKIIPFKDLSKNMRNCFLFLKNGDMTEPVKTGGKYVVFRLDKVEDMPVPESYGYSMDRNKIRDILVKDKKEKMMDDWITNLRKNAVVEISMNGNR